MFPRRAPSQARGRSEKNDQGIGPGGWDSRRQDITDLLSQPTVHSTVPRKPLADPGREPGTDLTALLCAGPEPVNRSVASGKSCAPGLPAAVAMVPGRG